MLTILTSRRSLLQGNPPKDHTLPYSLKIPDVHSGFWRWCSQPAARLSSLFKLPCMTSINICASLTLSRSRTTAPPSFFNHLSTSVLCWCNCVSCPTRTFSKPCFDLWSKSPKCMQSFAARSYCRRRRLLCGSSIWRSVRNRSVSCSLPAPTMFSFRTALCTTRCRSNISRNWSEMSSISFMASAQVVNSDSAEYLVALMSSSVDVRATFFNTRSWGDWDGHVSGVDLHRLCSSSNCVIALANSLILTLWLIRVDCCNELILRLMCRNAECSWSYFSLMIFMSPIILPWTSGPRWRAFSIQYSMVIRSPPCSWISAPRLMNHMPASMMCSTFSAFPRKCSCKLSVYGRLGLCGCP